MASSGGLGWNMGVLLGSRKGLANDSTEIIYIALLMKAYCVQMT